MTELTYETIPDQCCIYPVYDDGFCTMQHAEVNEKAWTARIGTAGEIESVTAPDSKTYTSFEQLQALDIKRFKIVCEHYVEINDYV